MLALRDKIKNYGEITCSLNDQYKHTNIHAVFKI